MKHKNHRELYHKLGATIAYQRRLKRMTQAHLAEKIDISTAHMSKIERGFYAGLTFNTLIAIAEGLEIRLNDLISSAFDS